MGSNHPARAQRVDLLGDLTEKGRDTRQAGCVGNRKLERGEAATVLLAGVPAPDERGVSGLTPAAETRSSRSMALLARQPILCPLLALLQIDFGEGSGR